MAKTTDDSLCKYNFHKSGSAGFNRLFDGLVEAERKEEERGHTVSGALGGPNLNEYNE